MFVTSVRLRRSRHERTSILSLKRAQALVQSQAPHDGSAGDGWGPTRQRNRKERLELSPDRTAAFPHEATTATAGTMTSMARMVRQQCWKHDLDSIPCWLRSRLCSSFPATGLHVRKGQHRDHGSSDWQDSCTTAPNMLRQSADGTHPDRHCSW